MTDAATISKTMIKIGNARTREQADRFKTRVQEAIGGSIL